MSLYRFAVGLLGPVLRLVWRPQVRGRENVPKEGGCILICNHLKWWDPLLLAVILPKQTLHFMAKQELFHGKFASWLLRRLNAFPVDRGKADLSAVRASISAIRSGGTLCIFPEGTRSKTGELLPFEEGTAFFALKCNCPIFAAHIDTERCGGKRLVDFGTPIDADAIGAELPRNARMALVTDTIRQEVLALGEAQKRERAAKAKKQG